MSDRNPIDAHRVFIAPPDDDPDDAETWLILWGDPEAINPPRGLITSRAAELRSPMPVPILMNRRARRRARRGR